jgi:hypothetical protein
MLMEGENESEMEEINYSLDDEELTILKCK